MSKSNELNKIFAKDLVLNREKLIEKLALNNATEITYKKIIKELKDDIVFGMDTNKDFVRSLVTSGDISVKDCNDLIKYLDGLIKKQIKYIDEFDFTTIDFKSLKVQKKK